MELIELIQNKLNEYNHKKIMDVINSKEDSARYVRNELESKYSLPNKDISLKKLRDGLGNRINHILFTFSLGLLFSDFLGLKERIIEDYIPYFEIPGYTYGAKQNFISEEHFKLFQEKTFLSTWLIISLYHDYGYFFMDKDITNFDEIDVTTDVFEFKDEKEFTLKYLYGLGKYFAQKCRYNKNEIKSYFNQKCIYNKNDDEPFDHGIYGGIYLFDKVITAIKNKERNNDKKIKMVMSIDENNIEFDSMYQNICFRIIEHNIWIVDNNNAHFKKWDTTSVPSLIPENFKKIGRDEPLLMLLSIVDTFEFLKKFSKCDKRDDYVESRPKTLMKKLDLTVSKDFIEVDYKEFEKHLTKNRVEQSKIDSWLNAIADMVNWIKVSVNIDRINKKITITPSEG